MTDADDLGALTRLLDEAWPAAHWDVARKIIDAGYVLRGVAQAPVKSAMTAHGALDIAANIAEALDSGRGNEKEIARAIRRVAKDGYWTLDGSLVPSTDRRDPVLHDERFPSASSVTSTEGRTP